MILVDANLLLYAYDSSSSHHARAKAWLEDRLPEEIPIVFCQVTLLAFLRLCTSPRGLSVPLPMEEALATVAS